MSQPRRLPDSDDCFGQFDEQRFTSLSCPRRPNEPNVRFGQSYFVGHTDQAAAVNLHDCGGIHQVKGNSVRTTQLKIVEQNQQP
jgi:hypothetical protein